MTVPLLAYLPVLEGTRCRLRELQPADAPAIRRHADDEAVWFNLFEGFPRPYTLAHAEAWCGGESRLPVFGHVFGIEVAVPGGREVIGCIGLRPLEGWLRCNAEIGYWIGSAHWRQGITGEAVGLVTDWAFAALPDLTRIYAPIFARNNGSQAVARHNGYALEGRQPRSAIKAGEVIDLITYGRYRPAAGA